MNSKLLTLLILAALTGCAGPPKIAPIDNALLTDVPSAGRDAISRARASRDAAEDAHALAQRNVTRAEQQLELGRVSLRIARTQFEAAELVAQFSKENGTAADHAKASAERAHAEAGTELAEQELVVREAELEVAELRERLTREEHDLSVAGVELAKAEALQGVDLVAAREIAIGDYRKRASYFRKRVESEQKRVAEAQADLDKALLGLDRARQKARSLEP